MTNPTPPDNTSPPENRPDHDDEAARERPDDQPRSPQREGDGSLADESADVVQKDDGGRPEVGEADVTDTGDEADESQLALDATERGQIDDRIKTDVPEQVGVLKRFWRAASRHVGPYKWMIISGPVTAVLTMLSLGVSGFAEIVLSSTVATYFATAVTCYVSLKQMRSSEATAEALLATSRELHRNMSKHHGKTEEHHDRVRQLHDSTQKHHRNTKIHYGKTREHHNVVRRLHERIAAHHEAVEAHQAVVENRLREVQDHHAQVEERHDEVRQHHTEVRGYLQRVEEHHGTVETRLQEVKEHHESVTTHQQKVQEHQGKVERHYQEIEKHSRALGMHREFELAASIRKRLGEGLDKLLDKLERIEDRVRAERTTTRAQRTDMEEAIAKFQKRVNELQGLKQERKDWEKTAGVVNRETTRLQEELSGLLRSSLPKQLDMGRFRSGWEKVVRRFARRVRRVL